MPQEKYIVYENNKINKETYYDFQNNLEENLTEEKKLIELEKKLELSVNSQLMSDVNLGCQLSGGMNSSLITLFAKNNKKKLDTFSILFKEKIFLKKFI